MADLHYLDEWRNSLETGLRGRSGGSGGGGMNDRIDRLETQVGRLEGKMDKVNERLTSIEVTLATISAKLDSKVDYKWLTIYVLGIVAVIMRSEIAAFFAGS